jgi:hypothetical protein
MNKIVPTEPGPRAPAIAEKLEAARGVLASYDSETAQTVLDAAENVAGAPKRLADLRSKISMAEREVFELEKAHALAAKIDRQSAVSAASRMRGEQLTEFKTQLVAREKAMAAALKAASDMAAAFGEYSESTLRAAVAVPIGTVVRQMAIGAEGFAGNAFGPCERLILAELYRLAPERQDGIGRFVLPFAKPSSEQTRGQPTAIKPGIEELLAADDAIVADIVAQIEKLNTQAQRAAGMIPSDRKDAA